jgi:NitT/TauT family transport system ATP-binding protein
MGPISLDIRAGEFLSIIAPPGSGTDALLKMIAGILPVPEGEIEFDSVPNVSGSRQIGVVLQRPALLGWRSILNNVLLQAEIRGLAIEESRNRARRLLALFGLSQFESRRPHELPHGTHQLVSICRALVHEPGLLLMDEPFRALDPLAFEKILTGFQRLWSESALTVVLCTTDLDSAVLLSDRIAVMPPHAGAVPEALIDLPRPRRLDKATAPLIAEHCSRIRTLLRAQGILP